MVQEKQFKAMKYMFYVLFGEKNIENSDKEKKIGKLDHPFCSFRFLLLHPAECLGGRPAPEAPLSSDFPLSLPV